VDEVEPGCTSAYKCVVVFFHILCMCAHYALLCIYGRDRAYTTDLASKTRIGIPVQLVGCWPRNTGIKIDITNRRCRGFPPLAQQRTVLTDKTVRRFQRLLNPQRVKHLR
jgi:hypothetical protein